MKQPRTSLWRRVAAIAAAAGVMLLAVAGCATTGSSQPSANQTTTAVSAVDTQSEAVAPTPRRTPAAAPTKAAPTRAAPARVDGLPVIYVDELPREGRETLRLIERDGPFPYDKDGSVFQNREGILPSRPRGYYREYTVITPWENDRGARRIVAGERDELYYTDDHYDSFKRIMER
jgi:ribonuclease T1